MEIQQKLAQKICDHFFTNCGATISKKDYDLMVEMLDELLLEHTCK